MSAEPKTKTRLNLLEDAIDDSVLIECEQNTAPDKDGNLEYEFTPSGSLWVKCWVRADVDYVIADYKKKLEQKKLEEL